MFRGSSVTSVSGGSGVRVGVSGCLSVGVAVGVEDGDELLSVDDEHPANRELPKANEDKYRLRIIK
jgi:hypothetical protein